MITFRLVNPAAGAWHPQLQDLIGTDFLLPAVNVEVAARRRVISFAPTPAAPGEVSFPCRHGFVPACRPAALDGLLSTDELEGVQLHAAHDEPQPHRL